MAIIQWLLAILIFLIPSNLFIQLWPQTAYVSGLRVDYLIPKLHLSELVLWLLVGVLIWNGRKSLVKVRLKFPKSSKSLVFFGLLVIFVFTQLFTAFPLASFDALLNWTGIVSVILLSWLPTNKKVVNEFFSSNLIFGTLVMTVLFQSVLGIYQFFTQKSLAGYWLLGEGNMQSFGQVSRVVLAGKELVAPLGTTAHSNVLAGVIVVFLVLIIRWATNKKLPEVWQKVAFVITLAVGLFCLTITFSTSGWLALIGGCLALWGVRGFHEMSIKRLFPILVVILLSTPLILNFFSANISDNTSLDRRSYLNQAGWQEWLAYPWTGVGLQNSTAFIEKFTDEREVVRFVQPPHHGGILLLAETGVVGVLLLAISLNWLKQSQKLKTPILAVFTLLPIILLDHYIFSIYSGNLLIWLLLLALYPDK